jgi:hypothetical protein
VRAVKKLFPDAAASLMPLSPLVLRFATEKKQEEEEESFFGTRTHSSAQFMLHCMLLLLINIHCVFSPR